MFEGLVQALQDNGIDRETDLLIHSSFRAIRSMAMADFNTENKIVAGALVQRLFHEFGDILVPTEFVADYILQSVRSEIIDFNGPSSRGYFTNAFLELPTVQRSKNPIYSIAVYGEKYSYSVAQHVNCEFSMDRNSPWAQFADSGGKVVFLGAGLHSCSIIHILEYQMGLKYPRPVFIHKPFPFFITDGFETRKVYGYVHGTRWGANTVELFLRFLNTKVSLLQEFEYRGQSVIILDALRLQIELRRLIDINVSWYDWEPQFQGNNATLI